MKNSSLSPRGLFLSCIISCGIWLILSLIMLLISCAISNSAEAPELIYMPLSLATLYISSTICGIISVKLSGDGIMSGIISGAIITIILLALSAFPLPDSGFSTPLGYLLLALTIPVTGVGAYIGKKRNKRPRSMLKKNFR